MPHGWLPCVHGLHPAYHSLDRFDAPAHDEEVEPEPKAVLAAQRRRPSPKLGFTRGRHCRVHGGGIALGLCLKGVRWCKPSSVRRADQCNTEPRRAAAANELPVLLSYPADVLLLQRAPGLRPLLLIIRGLVAILLPDRQLRGAEGKCWTRLTSGFEFAHLSRPFHLHLPPAGPPPALRRPLRATRLEAPLCRPGPCLTQRQRTTQKKKAVKFRSSFSSVKRLPPACVTRLWCYGHNI